MNSYIFFFIALTFILTHEMDAVKSREWAIFPFLTRLDEKTGYIVFTAIHIPLFLAILLALFGSDGLNRGFMIGLDIFFIVHVFLHVLFLNHPQNEFKSAFSWIIIVGAGVTGLLDLVLPNLVY